MAPPGMDCQWGLGRLFRERLFHLRVVVERSKAVSISKEARLIHLEDM
jgi:hypothetical protein